MTSIYKCEKHGDIGAQVLTIGYFDEVRNFIQKTFCGRCHFDMLDNNCYEAKQIPTPPKPEKRLIITR